MTNDLSITWLLFFDWVKVKKNQEKLKKIPNCNIGQFKKQKKPFKNRWENKKVELWCLLSIFQIFNVAHRGLHVVPGFVVEREQGGVVVRAVSQGSVRSAVSKGTRFAIRRQPVHLFFFFQEREFHFYFNCTAQTWPSQKMCENARWNKCSSFIPLNEWRRKALKWKSVQVIFTLTITSGLRFIIP